MNKQLEHHPQQEFMTVDGQLTAGDYSISALKNIVGQTPFFVYDKAVIATNVEHLRKALPNDIHIHYAIKANPHPQVTSILSEVVDGMDVASHQELITTLNTKFSGHQISIAGPGKSDTELLAAISAGVIINIESANELARSIHIGKNIHIKPQICLRINPDFQVKSSGMRMGGGSKPFGIDANLLSQLLKDFPIHDADFLGFHIFACSQVLHAEHLCEVHDHIFTLLSSLADDFPNPLKHLNLGGGFGIPYFPGDTPLDIESVGKNLERLLSLNQPLLKDCQCVMEFGRYLVGNAGLYVCEVIDKKNSGGEVFAITNGGLHHHLANSGNFGQVIRKNYAVTVANKMNYDKQEVINIAGPLCTPLDIVANKVLLATCEIGDLITVFNSGAYGYTASPNSFLGHPSAVEIIV